MRERRSPTPSRWRYAHGAHDIDEMPPNITRTFFSLFLGSVNRRSSSGRTGAVVPLLPFARPALTPTRLVGSFISRASPTQARLSALPSTGAADVAAVGGGPRGRETADHQPAVGVHAAGHTASHHQPPPTDADERRTPGKPSHTRSRNNRYTTSHRFIGITRRAPGDTRSNASRPWRAQVNYMVSVPTRNRSLFFFCPRWLVR